MSVAPRRFRSAATSASICLRVESCCASVCVPPEGTGGGAGFSWRRNRRLRNFIWTPQSLPNDASAPLLAVYHTAISHSNLVRPKRHRSGRTARQFRPHFISGRDSPPVRHGRHVTIPWPRCWRPTPWRGSSWPCSPSPQALGTPGGGGGAGHINDFIARYRLSGRSWVIRAPLVDTGSECG